MDLSTGLFVITLTASVLMALYGVVCNRVRIGIAGVILTIVVLIVYATFSLPIVGE